MNLFEQSLLLDSRGIRLLRQLFFVLPSFDDHNLRVKGFVNRALFRDFHQARLLIICQRAFKRDRALYAVYECIISVAAFGAIFDVNPLLVQSDAHALQRPLFAARVKLHRHRNAASERGQQ